MNRIIHFLSTSRTALILLLATLLTATAAQTARATTTLTVNVTGSGSVSIGNQTATAGNPFTTSVDDGASVTLTFAPDAGNIVTSAKLSYKTSEYGSTEGDITVSGSTATFQMPNNIWNGTGVTINVTFGDGLIGGADEASAVALTDATVSNLAGGYYKVESDISFDHTLNLIGNTYLVIASGAKMTVNSSEYGINGESYALNVLGEGTLNVTTTGSYSIAVCVSSYTQSGCSVNLTTSYMGMRCLNGSFNISGGSFKTNGSEGIWPDNDVNISGGKLEASNIDANINLSYSSTDDYIKVDNYTNGKTITIANGQTFTDGTTNYSGTITNLSPLNGKKLFPFVYMHLTVRDATCTEVGIKQECWQRSSDGKYFSDENGTTELNTSDVEIPMIAHNGVPHEATDTHIAYWQCSMCSKYFSEEGCTTEITEEETKIYRTIAIDDAISSLVTSNVDKAVAGTTVTLTVSHLIDASTLLVNGGSVTLTDAGNGTYTFTVPAADVTVTASTATTYSVNLPANMEIVSATTTADGSGKYISGTVVTFKANFSYTASNVSDGANTLTADGSGNYSVTVGTADITVTATIEHSSNIDLSQAPSDFTVVDGDILTAATSYTVTIADNAKITLSGATISGGIVCAGTAGITLVGTNSVSVSAHNKAGIQIGGSGTTLTIKGDGSLTATGGSASAGIGLGRTWDANATGGSIVIEGGTVTASGDNGIGTGRVGNSKTATVGDIIIKGGSVNARLGKGYIYNGSSVTIGAIKIYDTIDKVDASAITESVTYMHVDGNTETDVTASASTYFTIIEDGDRRIIEKKDDTDYSITITDNTEHGTIECAATTAKYGDKITITATPDFGYRLSSLVVKDAENNDVASTGNSFFMPKSNVTVSAVFEQGTHGTTEFAWGYFGPDADAFVTEGTIYDGVTTVNLQQDRSYQIMYDEYSYRAFLLDNDTYDATIPYSSGTGTFPEYGYGTNFSVDYNSESGFYDITMTDVGNGKWSVSILKTVGVIDNIPDQTYTGSKITPEPLVLAGSLSLTKGTDYEYSYTDNTNVGTATVTVTFKGGYTSLGSVNKTFTIVKATPTVTAPTPVEDLVYTGTAQELVTAGTTDFGTLIYSTDGENYSADIPTATKGGTYTVYYKVEGSDNWNAVDAQTVSVTIAPRTYTVTFDANGGSGTMEPMQLTYGGDWTALTANTFTRSGYGFNGWNTKADGSGTAYSDEEWVKNLTTETSIVLYAQWGKDIATCTATVPVQTMGGYSYIYYKFESANSNAELAAAMGVVVKDGDVVLTLGTDYEFGNVTFADGSDGMPASIGDECLLEIRGKGKYAGSLWAPFTITVADAGGTWGELAWTFHAGTLTISGTGAMDAASDYSGYPWFSVASNIKTITIGEGVTKIADAAFAGTSQMNYYSNVQTVSLPSTLTAIGVDAFAYCTGLTIAIPSGVTINNRAFYQVGCVVGTLSDAADNADIIGIMEAAKSADVQLQGRTLYKDGSWNTLCLPFDISTASGTLSGDNVQAMTLNTTMSNLTDGTLTLYFTTATTIPAGTPFIIKWDESGDDITSPVFEGVTVSNATHDATVEGVLTFTGTYAPVSIGSEGDKTKLYLGSGNMLYYPNGEMTIGSQRAYFQLANGLTAGDATSPVRAFTVNFGDDEMTGIISVHDSGFMVNGSDAWYTLDGRRLDGKPTQRGIYINNGKKVAIK